MSCVSADFGIPAAVCLRAKAAGSVQASSGRSYGSPSKYRGSS